MAEPGHALTPQGRMILRTAGVLLTALGFATVLGAFVTAAMGGQRAVRESDFEFNPIPVVVVFLLGSLVLSIGFWLLRLGFARSISSILATETAPAMETSAGAFGRGFGSASQRAHVKVKCRLCGALAPEEAKFCPNCGKAL